MASMTELKVGREKRTVENPRGKSIHRPRKKNYQEPNDQTKKEAHSLTTQTVQEDPKDTRIEALFKIVEELQQTTNGRIKLNILFPDRACKEVKVDMRKQ